MDRRNEEKVEWRNSNIMKLQKQEKKRVREKQSHEEKAERRRSKKKRRGLLKKSESSWRKKEAISLEIISLKLENCSEDNIPDIDTYFKHCKDLIEDLYSTEKNSLCKVSLGNVSSVLSIQRKLLHGARRKSHDRDSYYGFDKEKQKIPSDDAGDILSKSRLKTIEDTIVMKGHIKFADVIGLDEAKDILREAIIMPLVFPHLFTGKSRLAQAISSEIESTFFSVSSADLVSSWVGESEKTVKGLFQYARERDGRSVIFIDEIDSICRTRSSREEEYTRRIKTELLKEMEGVSLSGMEDKIFLLCATNCPWELDSAFLRRFQKRIYISLPERESRLCIMQLHCRDSNVNMDLNDWRFLVDNTEGYSGSDLANLVTCALMEPIREIQEAKYWKLKDGKMIASNNSEDAIVCSLTDISPGKVGVRDVTLRDFMKALKVTHRTVGRENIFQFEEFTKKLGQTGK